MITNFPADPGLPGLGTLLDEVLMIELLKENGLSRVTGCRPRYVRYKPATSCIVQYDLKLTDRSGESIDHIAHIKIYADGRGGRKAHGYRAKRIRERLNAVTPDIPTVVFLPELEGVFQVYPADLDLRPLARLSVKADAEKILRRLDGVSKSRKLASDPELVRFKPGRKALLRYRFDDEKRTVLYGKTYHNHDVALLAQQTEALIRAGVKTPPVVGLSERHVLIVHREGEGIALNEIRGTEQYSKSIKQVAAALWQLQSVQIPGAKVHTIEDEKRALRDVVEHLAHVVPAWRKRLTVIARSICDGLSSVDEDLRTAHGDFYDDQVLLSENGLTLIDFDEIRIAHPLLDAGNMLAHLSVAEINGQRTARAREIFAHEMREHFDLNNSAISLFECVGLLKLAPGPFRRVEEDWVQKIDRILALIEEKFAQAPSIDDKKLPQAVALLNPTVMSERLLPEGLEGLESIQLVRHKPGRRMIVRYDFADESTLYGKSFASKRGERVYRIARALWEARAFGPDVRMPEPVAWIPEHKLILTREVKGQSIQERLLSGDVDLATNIAFALFHLHSSDIDLGRWHDIEDEMLPLTNRLGDISNGAPELTAESLVLYRQLLDFDTSGMCWRYRPIHRDMYHDQVIAIGDRLAVLDLDDASLSEPIVDVANFAAHLILLGIQESTDAERMAPVIDAFRDQYRQLDNEFDDALYEYLVATTLFRLAGIHVSRENGAEVAKLLLESSRQILAAINAYPVKH